MVYTQFEFLLYLPMCLQSKMYTLNPQSTVLGGKTHGIARAWYCPVEKHRYSDRGYKNIDGRNKVHKCLLDKAHTVHTVLIARLLLHHKTTVLTPAHRIAPRHPAPAASPLVLGVRFISFIHNARGLPHRYNRDFVISIYISINVRIPRDALQRETLRRRLVAYVEGVVRPLADRPGAGPPEHARAAGGAGGEDGAEAVLDIGTA
jgi:hypothetical protein